MKRPARHVLTIALVATALCADRAVASAPALRPAVADVAGDLVTRLSVRFARVVPAVRVVEVRTFDRVEPSPTIRTDDLTSTGFTTRLLPQFLRLPPPAL